MISEGDTYAPHNALQPRVFWAVLRFLSFPPAAAAFLALASSGCGGRTPLSTDPIGASTTDAGPTRRDGAITPDTGPAIDPDAGARRPCRRDAECSGGVERCIADPLAAPRDLAPLELVCGALGPGVAPPSRCESARDCDRGICVLAGTCIAPCADDSDCEASMRCASVYARTSASTLQPLDGCVARIDAPPGTDVRGGGVARRLSGSFAEESVALPPVVMPTLVVLTAMSDVAIIATRLRTADGAATTIYDLESILAGAGAPLNGVAPQGTPLTLLLPNGPRAPLSAAGYTLGVLADGPTELDLTVVERPMRGSLLNVNVFYVGGRRWHPSGDRGPAEVAAALDEIDRSYAAAGVRIGRVRQIDVVGGLLTRFSVIEGGGGGELPDLGPLFALSAGAGEPALNIFLVREIDEALGVSGGIPGPHGMNGTFGSGIAIGADLTPMFGELGRTIAHEAGHYLGLFHTSEIDGSVFEPLPDTPECHMDRDADRDGFLLPMECGGAGAENLMFWAASGDAVSADQSSVVSSALLLE